MVDKVLIVGLGNPGLEYARTRHNVGFWVVDELLRRFQLPAFRSDRKALTADGTIHNRRVLLAKPQTYMNLSGEAVRSLMDFYKIERHHLIVIHDDLDLPLGTLRLRNSGSHGGQNGIRNIIMHLGSQDFARVRFGIGRPPGRMAARDYVLQKFIGDDEILAQQVTTTAADAVEHWLRFGMEQAMARYNGDISAGSADKQPEPDRQEQLKVALRAHELAPNDPKPLEQLAILYKKLRDLDQAAQAHLQLAALYSAAGAAHKMFQEWENASRIRPALTDIREQLARGYEQTGDPRRALQTWLKLAEYHDQHDQSEQALAMLQQALRLNPQHPKAIEMNQALRRKLVE
jgi:PTH1 family peptidyl-tRNA hydrolase